MIVKQLKLVQFRNYESLLLSPFDGLNVIVGQNAQGKTNIIEALFLLSFSRSHRTRKDNDLIQWEKESSYVFAEIESKAGTRTVEIMLSRQEKKSIFLDGTTTGVQKLLEVFHTVLFAPEDLSLIKQGPEVRRRFMDMELCKLKPSYFHDLQHYNGALKQKNALLKCQHLCSYDMMSAYDRQLAIYGAKVMKQRREFLEELSSIAADLNAKISQDRDQLKVEYDPDVLLAYDKAEDDLFEKIQESNELSIRRGFLCKGPHRDDIKVSLNEKDIRSFGSQGQHRSAALCLKLSQIEIYRRIMGEPPVLLLDDVLSELDSNRQQLLMENTVDCQTFLTGTEYVPLNKKAKVYNCEKAKLTEQLLD